jgi:hypothetical protein
VYVRKEVNVETVFFRQSPYQKEQGAFYDISSISIGCKVTDSKKYKQIARQEWQENLK